MKKAALQMEDEPEALDQSQASAPVEPPARPRFLTFQKSYFWKFGVSALLFVLALHWVDFAELRRIGSHPNPAFLLMFLLLMVIDRVIMAYKWGFLLEAVGIRPGLKDLVVIYYKGTFVGNLLPTSIGGDAIRIYEIKKRGGAFEHVASSIVVERFVGFLTASILALAALLLSEPLGLKIPLAIFVPLGIAFAIGVAALVAIFIGGAFFRTRMHLLERFHVAVKLAKIATSVADYQNHSGVIVRFFFWSLGEQIIPVFVMYALARGLNLGIPLRDLACIIPVTQFIARVPVTLSGIGLQENVLMGFFSLAGVEATAAFALGFAANIGTIISGLPGAYFYLAANNRETGTSKSR